MEKTNSKDDIAQAIKVIKTIDKRAAERAASELERRRAEEYRKGIVEIRNRVQSAIDASVLDEKNADKILEGVFKEVYHYCRGHKCCCEIGPNQGAEFKLACGLDVCTFAKAVTIGIVGPINDAETFIECDERAISRLKTELEKLEKRTGEITSEIAEREKEIEKNKAKLNAALAVRDEADKRFGYVREASK